MNFKHMLQRPIDANAQSWCFSVPNLPPAAVLKERQLVKFISVTSNSSTTEIKLSVIKCPTNRVTLADALEKFVLISFADFRLRYPTKTASSSDTDGVETEPAPPKDSAAFVVRMLSAGIVVNSTTYNFYGHSNSQLKSRSCFLFAAPKSVISEKIDAMGDFSRIKTVAKKAKRIGLLFSAAQMGVKLPPDRCEDIPDIQIKDYNFTDGCGLISKTLANKLVLQTKITFRGQRYRPTVFQIRYRGYKGVLTFEPQLKGQILVKFRDSMRKFKEATNLSLSVVDFSKPYAFGHLNDEVILLLSALGITNEVFLKKQAQHFAFLTRVKAFDPLSTFQFLCFCNQFELAEQALVDGVESTKSSVNKLVTEEYCKMLNKRGEQRSRIFVQKSRLLFGVCDPRDVLRAGECFVRITHENRGIASTLTGMDVLVGRNPCLHPGDLQKFRAVDCAELSHLVDCIVFPTRGKRPSADLMSGGDLDGDKFFVCWDSDLVPSIVSEPAAYPGAPEPPSFKSITDNDRLEYFAQYTSASLGKVKNLYLDWARIKGPMSAECQQLNRLFSQCVDGNRIAVPEHLQNLPKDADTEPGAESTFVLDVLHEAGKRAAGQRTSAVVDIEHCPLEMMDVILARDDLAISEFELIKLTTWWCYKHNQDFYDYAMFFDFNLLDDEQKAWALARFPPTMAMPALVMNGLLQSGILNPVDLEPFKLHYPGLRWRRVFDSAIDRMGNFLECTARVVENFHKKLIVFRLDERMCVGLYIPKKLDRQKECRVDTVVRVFAFPQSQGSASPNYRVRPTKTNYRLYCDSISFQLYEGARANTWVFLTQGPSNDSSYRNLQDRGDRRQQKQQTIDAGINVECRASIALNKIGSDIQRHMGRVHRQGLVGAEIYVIGNRDVAALQTLDLWLEFVDTQKTLPLFEQEAREYSVPTLADVDWNSESEHIVQVVKLKQFDHVTDSAQCSVNDVNDVLFWLLQKREFATMRSIYEHGLSEASQAKMSESHRLNFNECLFRFLVHAPFLISTFFNSSGVGAMEQSTSFHELLRTFGPKLLKSLLVLTNSMGVLILQPLEILLARLKSTSSSSAKLVSECVELVALTAPSLELALDIFFVQLEPWFDASGSAMQNYKKQLFGIALDHLDEMEECGSVRDRQILQMERKDASKKSKSKKADGTIVECRLRIDAPKTWTLKIGDHVRFQRASPPANAPFSPPVVIDAIVESVNRGLGRFRCVQELPSYAEACSWSLSNCTPFVSSKSMIDAVTTLYTQRECCYDIYNSIVRPGESHGRRAKKLSFHPDDSLNQSQNKALEAAMMHSMSLLWGPPGTGKTRTIVKILQHFLKLEPAKRILVAAPTHNAVDNILQKFIDEGGDKETNATPLRVSTDVRKVSDSLKRFTCDAMMGKDISNSPRLWKQAQQKIKECRLVFTTCIGAELGLLRGEKFEIVLIDEASQQPEAMTLVPLVKGCERAVLVGDHVQLRATIQQHAKLVDFDVSLFERLYTEQDREVCKVMLDTQYRMHREVCAFSSVEFYDGSLSTAVPDDARPLPPSQFPWDRVTRNVFVQCSTREDIGRKSKSNHGQALACRRVCQLLTTPRDDKKNLPPHSIVILTPYTRQIELMREMVSTSAQLEICSIDGFQGREADIVVFVTVRCNERNETGFLKDLRRLNVAMTRAKSGVVIIGDAMTLSSGSDACSVWKRLIDACARLQLDDLDA